MLVWFSNCLQWPAEVSAWKLFLTAWGSIVLFLSCSYMLRSHWPPCYHPEHGRGRGFFHTADRGSTSMLCVCWGAKGGGGWEQGQGCTHSHSSITSTDTHLGKYMTQYWTAFIKKPNKPKTSTFPFKEMRSPYSWNLTLFFFFNGSTMPFEGWPVHVSSTDPQIVKAISLCYFI